MSSQYSLQGFRLLPVGGAKALTNENSNGNQDEEDFSKYPPA